MRTGFPGSKIGKTTANSHKKPFGISFASKPVEPVFPDLGRTFHKGGPGQNWENPENPGSDKNKVPKRTKKSKIPIPIPVPEPVSTNLGSFSRMESPAQVVLPISYGKRGASGSKTGKLPGIPVPAPTAIPEPVPEPVSGYLDSTSRIRSPAQTAPPISHEKRGPTGPKTGKLPGFPVPTPAPEPASANLDSASLLRSPAQRKALISYGKLGFTGSGTGNFPKNPEPVFPVSQNPDPPSVGKTGLAHSRDLNVPCLTPGSPEEDEPEKRNPENPENLENPEIMETDTYADIVKRGIHTPRSTANRLVNYSYSYSHSDSGSSRPDPDYYISDTDSQESQGSSKPWVSKLKPKFTPRPKNLDYQESLESRSLSDLRNQEAALSPSLNQIQGGDQFPDDGNQISQSPQDSPDSLGQKRKSSSNPALAPPEKYSRDPNSESPDSPGFLTPPKNQTLNTSPQDNTTKTRGKIGLDSGYKSINYSTNTTSNYSSQDMFASEEPDADATTDVGSGSDSEVIPNSQDQTKGRSYTLGRGLTFHPPPLSSRKT